MPNPTRLTWQQPATNTDGSTFDAAQFNGFELEINEAPAVSVPIVWDEDGAYELPLAGLVAVDETGAYVMRMRTLHKNGNSSAWSAPVAFSMDFRVPAAPVGLSVSVG